MRAFNRFYLAGSSRRAAAPGPRENNNYCPHSHRYSNNNIIVRSRVGPILLTAQSAVNLETRVRALIVPENDTTMLAVISPSSRVGVCMYVRDASCVVLYESIITIFVFIRYIYIYLLYT